MDMDDKTKEELLREIERLRERLSELESSRPEEAGMYPRLSGNLPGIVYRVLLREGNRMVFFNDMIKALTGYSAGELKPSEAGPVFPLINPEDMEGVASRVRQAMEDGHSFEVGYRVTHRCGETRYFSEWGRSIYGLDQRPLFIDSVIFDITRATLAEKLLHESEQKYRHLFNNLNDAAFLAEIETGIIVETNIKGEELLGRPRSEIIGMHQSEVHPRGKAEEYRQKFKTHTEKGRLADYDGEVLRKDGSIVHARISAAPVRIGERDLILGLFHDITERKKIEAEQDRLIAELKEAFNRIKTLSGLLPICASCKKIRNDKGYWQQIENYIEERSEAEFTHGVCPDCAKRLYGDILKGRGE